MTVDRWESVIGIEVHVELLTNSKMFCGCPAGFGGEPNTNVCPTCLGLPGALPVPNETAIDWIARIGAALNCKISPRSVFHRKNYFYADLPKNYQITQFDIPVCHDGWLEVPVDGELTRVGIERAHQEEDTGKSIHVGEGGRIHSATQTLLDFNRSGVPLVEIVSKPDIRSAVQARVYAQELRAVIVELGVSDAKLEEGSMRFDANISVRPHGVDTLGVKVEIKNMNSFRSLERAVEYEIVRQVGVIEAGGKVIQETRHWDEDAGVTQGMRTKEGSSDYRYFVEPDLVPMVIDQKWRERVMTSLPELPAARRHRYLEMGLDGHLAQVLTGADPAIRGLFADTVAAGAEVRPAAGWVTGEVTAWLRREGADLASNPLGGPMLAGLLAMIGDGRLSSTAAKEVLDGMMSGEGGAETVAATRDLLQVSDTDAIGEAVDRVLAANPDAIERFRDGEQKVIGFLVGQVMRATGGKADPQVVNRLLTERLS